jgi:hypothetical protein
MLCPVVVMNLYQCVQIPKLPVREWLGYLTFTYFYSLALSRLPRVEQELLGSAASCTLSLVGLCLDVRTTRVHTRASNQRAIVDATAVFRSIEHKVIIR